MPTQLTGGAKNEEMINIFIATFAKSTQIRTKATYFHQIVPSKNIVFHAELEKKH